MIFDSYEKGGVESGFVAEFGFAFFFSAESDKLSCNFFVRELSGDRAPTMILFSSVNFVLDLALQKA